MAGLCGWLSPRLIMRFLLLQSSVYFPSFGGGNKSNRLLLEALAKRGHQCYSISKSIDAQTVIDKRSEQEVLIVRGIETQQYLPGVNYYKYNGVSNFSFNTIKNKYLKDFIKLEYNKIKPDIILVSDDKTGELLDVSLSLSAAKTVLILHTNLHLPFGSEASSNAEERKGNYHICPNILSSTHYTQRYLFNESAIKCQFLPFPVFGEQIFQNQAQFQQGSIGMINPCAIKGISIFLGLAQMFPRVTFLAVPTWGATKHEMRKLNEMHNITVVEPQDDIGEILKQLSVLIVPSLIPETFGYVTVEAMLRGIPVLASDLGGLVDAKLGTDYLLPVNPAINQNGQHQIPTQNIQPWADALSQLTDNQKEYKRCSEASFIAANQYRSNINVLDFEHYFDSIKKANDIAA